MLSTIFWPNSVRGESIDLTPSIAINSGYNDNITFDIQDPVEDFYTSVEPEIKLNIKDVDYGFGMEAYSEIIRFKDENDLDTEKYMLGINSDRQLSPLLAIEGDVSYLKDTTLDSELEETGRVLEREDRHRYIGNARIKYKVDAISELNLDYQYRNTQYESDTWLDRERHRIRVPYKRWFNSRLDRWEIRPAYTFSDLENGDTIDYYDLSIGWLHKFSNTWQMNNYIGYGYAVNQTAAGENTQSSGTANLSLTHFGEIFTLLLGLWSNIDVGAEGELDEIDRLYGRVERKITERLTAIMYGSVFTTRPVDDYHTIDSIYYNFKPELDYRITEKHSLNLFYRYSYEDDQTLSGDSDKVRNIIGFSFKFQFPIKKSI